VKQLEMGKFTFVYHSIILLIP